VNDIDEDEVFGDMLSDRHYRNLITQVLNYYVVNHTNGLVGSKREKFDGILALLLSKLNEDSPKLCIEFLEESTDLFVFMDSNELTDEESDAARVIFLSKLLSELKHETISSLFKCHEELSELYLDHIENIEADYYYYLSDYVPSIVYFGMPMEEFSSLMPDLKIEGYSSKDIFYAGEITSVEYIFTNSEASELKKIKLSFFNEEHLDAFVDEDFYGHIVQMENGWKADYEEKSLIVKKTRPNVLEYSLSKLKRADTKSSLNSAESKELNPELKKKNPLFLQFGLRQAMGRFAHDSNKDGWGGKSGFGIDLGVKYNPKFYSYPISIGLNVTYLSGSIAGAGLGPYFNIDIPQINGALDFYYKLGPSIVSFNYMEDIVSSTGNINTYWYNTKNQIGFAWRNNIGLNLRFVKSYINAGFAWGNSKQDIHLEMDEGDFVDVYYEGQIVPSGMFCLNVGFVF